MTVRLRAALVCLLVTTVTFLGPGCPRTTSLGGQSITKKGRVTVLFNSAAKSLSQALIEATIPKSVVAADEIYSLTLTVTQISLSADDDEDDDGDDDHGEHGPGHDGDDDHGDHGPDHDGDDDHGHDGDVDHGNDNDDDKHQGDVEDDDSDDVDDDQGDDESDDDHGEDGDHEDGDDDSVVIFEGSQDVDLVSLDNLSQVFSTNNIPAGVYHRITLSIENPRLRLASDPETEITDIHLTCNERLFVNAEFEIPEGGNSLISLTFNGVHLIREGNGSYVLTPQLDASVSVTSADVAATGTIASVSTDEDSMVVTLADGDVTVLYAGAAIFLPGDTDTATGSEGDLTAGASVDITGTIDADGVITATEIRLL